MRKKTKRINPFMSFLENKKKHTILSLDIQLLKKFESSDVYKFDATNGTYRQVERSTTIENISKEIEDIEREMESNQ